MVPMCASRALDTLVRQFVLFKAQVNSAILLNIDTGADTLSAGGNIEISPVSTAEHDYCELLSF